MLNLGLSAAERKLFNKTLVSDHKVRIRASLRTLENEPITGIGEDVEDGQITVKGNRRMCELTIFDPEGSFPLDSGSPASGALFVDRMIRVRYDIKPPGAPWFEVPVFTGPVTRLVRSGDTILVEASDMSELLRGEAFYPKTYQKGEFKVRVIEQIARKYGGIRRFDLPNSWAQLPKKVSLKRDTRPWAVMQRIANSMGMQLFFDARGILRLRRRPGNVQWTFTGGVGGELLSEPEVEYSLSEDFANAVWVKGGSKKKPAAQTPKGGKDRDDDDDIVPGEGYVWDDEDTPWDETTEYPPLRLLKTAPRAHPLSPWSIGAHGTPRFYLHVIENEKIKTKAEAEEVAQEALDRHMDTAQKLRADSLVIPHLEAGDVVRVATDDIAVTSRLTEFAIPLNPEQPMTIGYSRNLKRKRRNRRVLPARMGRNF